MSHSHHAHDTENVSDARLLWSVLINKLLTVAQVIAGYVLWQVVKMLPAAVRILMEGTPEGLDLDALADRMAATNGVAGFHHLHVWELDEHHRALEAHVVLETKSLERWPQLKSQLKRLLENDFGIGHTALEPDFGNEQETEKHGTGLISEH